MPDKLDASSARLTIGIALMLGALADLLLRTTPWGINATLWLLSLTVASFGLGHRIGIPMPARAPLALGALFGLGFSWRASTLLLFLLGSAVLVSWMVALLDRPARAGLVAHAVAGFTTLVNATLLPAIVLPMVRRESGVEAPIGRIVSTAARGSFLAAPALVVLGLLLASADPVFGRYLSDAADAMDDVFEHISTTLVTGWVCAGLLIGLGAARCPADIVGPRRRFAWGGEVLVALALVVALFAAFLGVQARVLYGGRPFVEATIGLSYSEYARHGFYQLVACATIALSLLAPADWAVPPGAPGRRRFVALASALTLILIAILASAARRMSLYVDTYGLTELRLYSLAFMVWLALVCLIFMATVLAAARRRLALGSLVSAAVVIVALVLLNPDGAIVRYNAGRAGKEFDASYAGSLSADAVPSLLAVLPRVDTVSRCRIAATLLKRWGHTAESDWRTWSLSRWRAHRALATSHGRLESIGRQCPG